MGTTLADLKPPLGAKHREKRLGRGPGSGRGTTAGRGQKGQGARSGGSKPASFQGGQMPLQRRLPKRGFKSLFRVAYEPVNVSQLAAMFEAGDVVDTAAVIERGLVSRQTVRWKLLGDGALTQRLIVRPQACSETAKEKVVAAGGTVELVDEIVRHPKRSTSQGMAAPE